jgi:Restriction endonuclease
MKTRDVVEKLEQTIGFTGSPRLLKDAIEYELVTTFALPAIEAAEVAEEKEDEVRDLIMENEANLANPILTIRTASIQFVEGTCYASPGDSPAIAAAKRQRLHIDKLLDQIHALTFHEFEIFGGCVLRELGASTVTVTPHAGDQGIDFYGLLSLGQNSLLPQPFGRLAHDVQLRFAGQAKHYPTDPIRPEMLRELIGSVSLARYKVYTTSDDLFEDFKLLPFNPLVSMFFRTGRFSSGALDLAEKAGIIARSGEQLAVFLADKGVGMSKKRGKAAFNSKDFREWLEREMVTSAP